MEIGERFPCQLLLPSSDETAWLYAENAAILGNRFVLYQPPVETICRILDKSQLAAAALDAGIATPPTWSALDTQDISELAETFPYPVLIKPRTHVQRASNSKGVVVQDSAEFRREWVEFVNRESKGRRNGDNDSIARPLVQQMIQSKAGTISITGFLDRARTHYVTRRCIKVFQRLGPMSVGVCFEALPPDEELSDAVRRLCDELGYFGMFEAEFLPMDGRWALIDFNPRLFNQVALDIYREMPLPLLACLDAMDEHDRLRKVLERAQNYDQSQPATIQDRFTLRATLFARAMRGPDGRAARDKWRGWMMAHAPHMIDLVADRRDPLPTLVHIASEINLGLRALPRFMRGTSDSATAEVPMSAERAT
jgi:hypothetical protein